MSLIIYISIPYFVILLIISLYIVRALIRYDTAPIADYDLSSLRVLGSVGEPINPEAWKWVSDADVTVVTSTSTPVLLLLLILMLLFYPICTVYSRIYLYKYIIINYYKHTCIHAISTTPT